MASFPSVQPLYNVGLGVTGNLPVEFGKTIAGKQADAGKISYRGISTTSLDVVGAGNVIGTRSVRVYDDLVVTSNATVNNILYVGVDNSSTAIGAEGGKIQFGGTYGDTQVSAAYNHCVLASRLYATPESSELVIFKGNDAETDRIRLRAPLIVFDTFNDYSASYTTENIRMTLTSTGNLGIGTTSPSTRLHVVGDSKLEGNVDVTNNARVVGHVYFNHERAAVPSVGVTGGTGDRLVLWPGGSTYFPYSIGINAATMWYNVPLGSQHQIQINGTTQCLVNSNGARVTGNVRANNGTLGPMLLLHWDFADVAVGVRLDLGSKEPGAPGGVWGFSMFHGAFLNVDNSGEETTWTQARLIIRGCSTGNVAGSSKAVIQQFHYVSGWNNCTSEFDIGNVWFERGYQTSISPWFGYLNGNTDVPNFGIKLNSSVNGFAYRFGPVYIQFR